MRRHAMSLVLVCAQVGRATGVMRELNRNSAEGHGCPRGSERAHEAVLPRVAPPCFTILYCTAGEHSHTIG